METACIVRRTRTLLTLTSAVTVLGADTAAMDLAGKSVVVLSDRSALQSRSLGNIQASNTQGEGNRSCPHSEVLPATAQHTLCANVAPGVTPHRTSPEQASTTDMLSRQTGPCKIEKQQVRNNAHSANRQRQRHIM